LVAAAFTHRDSRAGDPDLHTHVAVANKVQTLAGRWLSIDGRVLHSAKVAASETYNTSLEYHLTASLGVPRSTQPTPPTSQRPSWTRRSPAPSDSPAAACRYPCGQATTHNGIGDLRDCAVTIAERGTAFFAHPRLNAIAASMPSWSDRLPFLEAPATEA
jgi:hypothetical protein